MARRADHSKAELNTLVIDTAEELIAEHGIDAFSARSLSRAIGYTAGTLYHHFRDLDDIVTQVNTRTLSGLALAFADIDDTSEPRQRLHDYADAVLAYIGLKKNLWNALFEFRRHPDVPMPAWYLETIASLIRNVARSFVEIRPDLGEAVARKAGILTFASVHSVVSLESSGRLGLIVDGDINDVVHDIVATHILAYEHRKA
jgi:AcrR family transcriptional regulator